MLSHRRLSLALTVPTGGANEPLAAGDWQMRSGFSHKVPDESGRYVRNPIATIRVENLRQPAPVILGKVFTFALLLAGWSWMPAAHLFWTAVNRYS